MNQIQNIDFNNPSEEMIFELCMDDLNFSFDTSKYCEIEINRVAHRDRLARYELESYSDMLIGYQKKWFIRQDSLNNLKKDVFLKYKEKLMHQLEVSQILKMFLTPGSIENDNLSITFTGLYNKIITREFNLKKQIQTALLKEFERLELNETELSREEAIEEIKDCDDPEWLQEYAAGDCFDGNGVNPEFITEELIENYIIVHYKPRKITLELVNRIITENEASLKEDKEKVGAKIKNLAIGEFAKRLSYIYCFNLFLNQDKIDSIKVFPLTNKACRFIYDYFEFWGLLNDRVKFRKSEKEKRATYIKSLINNNERLAQKGILEMVKGYKIIDPNLELKIDLFKKVKDGLKSQEDFQNRINIMKN